MNRETAFQALELGLRLNRGKPCSIVFFGGEPLLRRDVIYATVSRAREMTREGKGRFYFRLTTNGLLLDSELLSFSLANNIQIAISIDGIREAQDTHRRLPDGSSSFDRVRAKLELLLAAQPYASVLMTVTPATVKFLGESVEQLSEMGVKYMVISPDYTAPWQSTDLKVLKGQYQHLADLYLAWTREHRKFYLSPFEVKLLSHIDRQCHLKNRCELIQRQITVDPQGFLFPCVQFIRGGPQSSWCIGHLKQGVDEAARSRIHARSTIEKEPCRTCAIRDRCNNTCSCLNWHATGSIETVSPVLCRSEQMLLPIADRVGKILYEERNETFVHKHYNPAYPVLSLLEDTLCVGQIPKMLSR